MSVDWTRMERAWFEAVCAAIVRTCNSNPGERFYAGAFWLLHGDYASLLVPAFGMNSERYAADARWHPPDWRWSIIDETHERVRPLYDPLKTLDLEPAAYESLWEQHVDMLARVSRRVTEWVRSREIPVEASALSARFFVGIIDFAHGDDGVEYLRRSVDEATIAAVGILAETDDDESPTSGLLTLVRNKER